jgi:hypothetical protein
MHERTVRLRPIADIGVTATLRSMMKEYVLDGTRITSLEAFYDVISEVLIPDATWGRNLDAMLTLREQGLGIPRPSGNWKNAWSGVTLPIGLTSAPPWTRRSDVTDPRYSIGSRR